MSERWYLPRGRMIGVNSQAVTLMVAESCADLALGGRTELSARARVADR